MRSLSGKVAVVTGAGSGIGRALALGLADHGCSVAMWDVNGEKAAGTASAAEGVHQPYSVDVADAEAVWCGARQVQERFGAVDIVANIAGIGLLPRPATAYDLSTPHPITDEISRLMAVNALGVMNVSLAFLPALRQRPHANLVNAASEAGLVGFYGELGYSASKFAVRGFTEALQMETVGSNVTVTMAYPGGTKTSIMANSPFIGDDIRDDAQRNFDGLSGLMTPEAAAKKLITGIRRDRSRVLLHPSAKVFSGIARIAPGLYPRIIGPVIRRMATAAAKDLAK